MLYHYYRYYFTIIISLNLPHKRMKAYYLSNVVVGPALMHLTLLWGYRQETKKNTHSGVC